MYIPDDPMVQRLNWGRHRLVASLPVWTVDGRVGYYLPLVRG